MRDPKRPHFFAPDAHAAFKAGGRRRLLAAAAVAAVALVVMVLLGPDQQEIKRRFEYYGAPGELRIMPDISIDEGRDKRPQLPRSLQQPPPPAEIIVEDEPDDPEATEKVARPKDAPPSDVVPLVDPSDADEATENLVEMALPQQSSPDYFILHMVNPDYPLNAPESERRIPRIFVTVEAFVGPDGRVSDTVIRATNGGPAYGNAAREAFAQWVLGWRVDPGPGRWLVRTWYFKSPYFSGGEAGRR